MANLRLSVGPMPLGVGDVEPSTDGTSAYAVTTPKGGLSSAVPLILWVDTVSYSNSGSVVIPAVNSRVRFSMSSGSGWGNFGEGITVSGPIETSGKQFWMQTSGLTSDSGTLALKLVVPQLGVGLTNTMVMVLLGDNPTNVDSASLINRVPFGSFVEYQAGTDTASIIVTGNYVELGTGTDVSSGSDSASVIRRAYVGSGVEAVVATGDAASMIGWRTVGSGVEAATNSDSSSAGTYVPAAIPIGSGAESSTNSDSASMSTSSVPLAGSGVVSYQMTPVTSAEDVVASYNHDFTLSAAAGAGDIVLAFVVHNSTSYASNARAIGTTGANWTNIGSGAFAEELGMYSYFDVLYTSAVPGTNQSYTLKARTAGGASMTTYRCFAKVYLIRGLVLNEFETLPYETHRDAWGYIPNLPIYEEPSGMAVWAATTIGMNNYTASAVPGYSFASGDSDTNTSGLGGITDHNIIRMNWKDTSGYGTDGILSVAAGTEAQPATIYARAWRLGFAVSAKPAGRLPAAYDRNALDENRPLEFAIMHSTTRGPAPPEMGPVSSASTTGWTYSQTLSAAATTADTLVAVVFHGAASTGQSAPWATSAGEWTLRHGYSIAGSTIMVDVFTRTALAGSNQSYSFTMRQSPTATGTYWAQAQLLLMRGQAYGAIGTQNPIAGPLLIPGNPRFYANGYSLYVSVVANSTTILSHPMVFQPLGELSGTPLAGHNSSSPYNIYNYIDFHPTSGYYSNFTLDRATRVTTGYSNAISLFCFTSG